MNANHLTFTFFVAAMLAVIGAAVMVQADPPPSEKWMAHCAKNLEGEGIAPGVVRKYCACMADTGEEAEMLTWTQGDLERAYPPAHRLCHIEARKP